MASKKFYASFRAAIKSQGNSFVMLNNAPGIDPDLWELYFEAAYDAAGDEADNDDFTPAEVYQWFISDCSDSDAEWLQSAFPSLILCYSEVLEAWLLPVTHYGTSWDYVACELSEDPRFEGCKKWLEPCKG